MAADGKITPVEQYYMELSEIYMIAYQNNIEPATVIMQAMGVIVEMESDLLLFLQGKPQTEKTKRQQTRLDILKKAVNQFSIVSERNLQFRMVAGKLRNKIDEQAETINDLQAEIIKLNKQLEGM